MSQLPSPPSDPSRPGPTVSVLTATRNRPTWVRETLTSIKDQTFTDFESILVDDGSSPETLASYQQFWSELD
jgi:glycosyltransferase involved in cell wall biosynthesis